MCIRVVGVMLQATIGPFMYSLLKYAECKNAANDYDESMLFCMIVLSINNC